MAKTSPARPPRALSEGYPGIIFFTIVAMALAIGLMAYELNEEYDWNSDGGKTPLRKASPIPPPRVMSGTGAPAPVDPMSE